MIAGQGGRLGLAGLVAPAALFTTALIAFPLLYTGWLSLQTVQLGGAAHWAGLANYRHMGEDGQFWNGLWISLVLYVVSLVLQLVVGTYLALLLYGAKRMPGVLRALLVSPFMLPPVVAGMMFLVILDPSIGAANWVLQSLGLPPSAWLASPQWVVPTLALIDTWQWAPYVALIVLGGLQSLPASVYEAAQIDGANRWRTFRRITLPLLLCPRSPPPQCCAAWTCCASSTSSTSRPKAAPAMRPTRSTCTASGSGSSIFSSATRPPCPSPSPRWCSAPCWC